ncbi:choice-of-anchor J domain-containing protein [Xylanibacter muris]|uniref:BIG2 domain-containing protein n=1 Tax=Xylanibacter muris TaxID=2736290 RepID=A0ABX2AIH1_9BACT|nr:choice-of-anchor J domain-containing protein [Xylanibacter muris]NPD90833.1 hypothetical protein [Xylanibacter muris]
MNKTLRYSLLSMLMLICGMAGAQVTVTFDATTDKAGTAEAAKNVKMEKDGISITVGEGILGNGKEYRCYKSQTMTVESALGNIMRIEVTCTANGTAKYGPGCFTVNGGSYSYSDKIGTWTGDAASVVFTASSNQVRMTKIEVTYLPSGTVAKKNAGLKFSETNVTAVLGEAFTAPTLTKETTADVVYSSGDANVATVDAQTGVVSLVGAGVVVIEAKTAENDEFAAGTASYELKVLEPVKTEVNEPYTESFELGIGSFTLDNVSLGEGLSYVWKHDDKFKYMKASAYVSGKNIASESWLVSPWIVLSSAEVVRTLSFDQCVSKYFADVTNEATLWIKEDGGDWKQFVITYPEIPEGKSFSEFEKQSVSLAGYEGKKIKVGFKYVSSDKAAGTWEIKNFSVGSGSSDVSGITADKAADKTIYNLAGQRLEKLQKGINIVGGKKIIVK